AREHREPGQNVMITAEVTLEAEQLKLLARSAEPLDKAVVGLGGASAGFRVYVEETDAVTSVKTLLERAAAQAKAVPMGPIALTLMSPDLPGEVDVVLGDRLPVSPQLRGAIKAVQGVLTVEDLDGPVAAE
ncbi:MAG: DNA polymerase III subunit alpha, partial [Pseudomonadota bacterium]